MTILGFNTIPMCVKFRILCDALMGIFRARFGSLFRLKPSGEKLALSCLAAHCPDFKMDAINRLALAVFQLQRMFARLG